MRLFEKCRISLSTDSDGDSGINVELPRLHHVMMQQVPKYLADTLESSVGYYLRKLMTLRLQVLELQKSLQVESIWSLLLDGGYIYISPSDNIVPTDIQGANETVKKIAETLSVYYFELYCLTDELICQSLGIDTAHSSRLALFRPSSNPFH